MERAYPALADETPDAAPRRSASRASLISALVLALLLAVGVAALLATRDGTASDSPGGMTQRVDGGNVTVAVTWRGLAAGPVFDVALDTHSVDLDGIDLGGLAVLRVDGAEIQPLSWDARKGGHHREGTLTFPATTADGSPVIDTNAAVELIIRDVAGVSERTFRWNP
jgi:hypothetical protein